MKVLSGRLAPANWIPMQAENNDGAPEANVCPKTRSNSNSYCAGAMTLTFTSK